MSAALTFAAIFAIFALAQATYPQVEFASTIAHRAANEMAFTMESVATMMKNLNYDQYLKEADSGLRNGERSLVTFNLAACDGHDYDGCCPTFRRALAHIVSCPSLYSLLLSMSSGTIPNVATIVSYCGSTCFENLKTIVATGSAANGTASSYGCDLVLPLRLLTQLLCLNGLDGQTCFNAMQLSAVDMATPAGLAAVRNVMCTKCGGIVSATLSTDVGILGNMTTYMGTMNTTLLGPLCARDPNTHAWCMDQFMAANATGDFSSLDPCGFCVQYMLPVATSMGIEIPADITASMACGCNGPPGKTCLGVLYENAKAANTTFLGTGMGGPCAVMLVGIPSCSATCKENLVPLLDGLGCCTECLLKLSNSSPIINYTLPAPAALIGTFSAACGISLSYSNLSVCPPPTPEQATLTLNGLKYDWVVANEAAVKAAVARSIATSVKLPEAAVSVVSFTNTGAGVAFTFAFAADTPSRTTIIGAAIQNSAMLNTLNLTDVLSLTTSSSGAAYIGGDAGVGITAFMPIASASPMPKKSGAIGLSLSPLVVLAVALIALALSRRD